MMYFSIAATILACAATVNSAALAQANSANPGGPETPTSTCTFTATAATCAFPTVGIVQTITVYEVPFVATTTQTFDCQGCSDVTIAPKPCPQPAGETTALLIDPTDVVPIPESTTTVAVCSPTPN